MGHGRGDFIRRARRPAALETVHRQPREEIQRPRLRRDWRVRAHERHHRQRRALAAAHAGTGGRRRREGLGRAGRADAGPPRHVFHALGGKLFPGERSARLGHARSRLAAGTRPRARHGNRCRRRREVPPVGAALYRADHHRHRERRHRRCHAAHRLRHAARRRIRRRHRSRHVGTAQAVPEERWLRVSGRQSRSVAHHPPGARAAVGRPRGRRYHGPSGGRRRLARQVLQGARPRAAGFAAGRRRWRRRGRRGQPARAALAGRRRRVVRRPARAHVRRRDPRVPAHRRVHARPVHEG